MLIGPFDCGSSLSMRAHCQTPQCWLAKAIWYCIQTTVFLPGLPLLASIQWYNGCHGSNFKLYPGPGCYLMWIWRLIDVCQRSTTSTVCDCVIDRAANINSCLFNWVYVQFWKLGFHFYRLWSTVLWWHSLNLNLHAWRTKRTHHPRAVQPLHLMRGPHHHRNPFLVR